jgi:hypothetical protein
MVATGAAWAARVEFEFKAMKQEQAVTREMGVDAMQQVNCRLKRYGQLLNWIGVAVERAPGATVPTRPLVSELDCEG